jgi:hypothetical protein
MVIIITSRAAERIADEILSTNEEILAISIIDQRKGNILVSKPKESFTKAFGVFQEGPKYGGSLAISALSIANEVREIAGEAQSIITTYEKCKMMLLPIPSYEIVVGLVLQRSVNAEDYNIGNTLEGLLLLSKEEEEER